MPAASTSDGLRHIRRRTHSNSKYNECRRPISHPITHVAMTPQDITVRHVPAPHPRPDEVHVGKGACAGGSLTDKPSEASRRTAQTQRKVAPRQLTHDAGTIHRASTEHTVRRPTTSVRHMHEWRYPLQRAADACMMQERDCADTRVTCPTTVHGTPTPTSTSTSTAKRAWT
jgi:hypothetical protein